MLQTFEVTIEGIAPLLINRFHEMSAEEATSGVHVRKEQLSPEEDARNRLYPSANGYENTIPAENVRQSIIAASSRTKIGRRSATTDVAASVYVLPELLPLKGTWCVDSRAIVIPSTRGRILRHRPRFDTWQVDFSIQINVDLVDTKTVRKILEDAGALVGLGDFRPARKGPYGRFTVTRWEKIG